MKAYKVNVNGNVYEITIEVIDKADIKAPAAPAPAPAAAPAPVAAPAGAQTVSAPMPGTILKVNVSNGQAVKKGDVLMILEAMKMENEILAANDGTVSSVNVTAGQSVESGTVLCTLN
ncbi:MAG: biotin/lipoyl-binding protein [Clostridia bacterium]|nr:biotin/lipoyl-binding protein [Clostridia bacterium]